jgi:hypothetical protein
MPARTLLRPVGSGAEDAAHLVGTGGDDGGTTDDVVAPSPTFPRERGVVYWHVDTDGVLLYVGSSSEWRFRQRLLSHARSSRWWRHVTRVHSYRMVTPDAARVAEKAIIQAEHPLFNRIWVPAEQAARAAAYLLAHSEVADPWPHVTKGEATRIYRHLHADAMLEALGVLHAVERGSVRAARRKAS